MRILVTGATGFVGSHCIQALARHREVKTIAACRDPSRLPDGFQGEARIGDLRDVNYLNDLTDEVDVVIHAAAWTSLWGHEKASEALFLNPSLALIEAARQRGVKRFVFISTVSAADPLEAKDPMSRGIKRNYWPHEANVVTIEDRLRALSGSGFCAVNLRLGLFAGPRYALGLLPILAPRLKTHLVPWVAGGRTGMAITDGRDIGACVALAATRTGLAGYQGFNVVGPEVPRVGDVIDHLHWQHGLPRPHFSVSFPLAFGFAWVMEKLDPILPWEPLVTRSIIHLLQETSVDNDRATRILGYRPRHHWKEAIDAQLAEMVECQTQPMSMARPVPGEY
ncbi:MAG: NAD(P)-dependent oxidoreductase [Candidatus Thiodiazotropha sp.]